MKFLKEIKVYYSDTDAYKVAWHGSYLRWMEAARCDMCEQLGFSLEDLAENDGIIFPIINIDIKYKHFAKLYDDLIVETMLKDFKHSFMTFEQIIKNKNTSEISVIAKVKAVAVNKNGDLIKKIPDNIKAAFEQIIE